MKALSPVGFAPVGKAAAVTVIMGLCMAGMPLAILVLLPFLALPLAHVVARLGALNGLIVAVVTGALVYVGAGVGMAALVLLIALGMGVVLGHAVRKGWTFAQSLAATSGAALAALLLWGTTLWLALGLSLTQLRETAYSSIDGAAAFNVQMGVGAEATDAVSAQLRQFVDNLPYLAPGLVGMAVILLAACALGLAYLLFPRVREKVAVGLSLSRFRMHWSAAYMSIVGLAVLLFARGDGDSRTVMLYVGINVLLISQTLFFVQGLAVARWLAINRQLRLRSRVALYVAAILGQALFQLTALVGLFDTWVDYRKRFALKSPGTGSPR